MATVAFSLHAMRGHELTQLPAWRYDCIGQALKGQPQATASFEADGHRLQLKRPVARHGYDLRMRTEPIGNRASQSNLVS